MGSGLGSPETVLFLFRFDGDEPDPRVCHMKHRECEQEWPHLMSECGRFTVKGRCSDDAG